MPEKINQGFKLLFMKISKSWFHTCKSTSKWNVLNNLTGEYCVLMSTFLDYIDNWCKIDRVK